MKINGINGLSAGAGQMGMNQMTDSVSKNIQKQIANAQKQLQELSAKDDMSLEEKMKKRQEIQQKISDLNNQLRQHQIELRRERQQAKSSSMEDMLGGTRQVGSRRAGSKNIGLSQASMTAIISADSSMKQAKAQGSVAAGLEGRAGVLKAEMKQDAGRGVNVESKKKELADVEQKAQEAAASQLSSLADAGRTMEEAAKSGQAAEKTDNKDSKTKTGEQKATNAKEDASVQEKKVSVMESQSVHADISVPTVTETSEVTTAPQQTAKYLSIDIRL